MKISSEKNLCIIISKSQVVLREMALASSLAIDAAVDCEGEGEGALVR